MKYFSFLLLTIFFCSCHHNNIVGMTGEQPVAEKRLFLVEQDGKIGYIDSAGHIIISPRFRNAGDFSEGRAYARVDGRFGFIDSTGSFIIAPQYDRCLPFSEGLALVYKDEKPLFIDHQGKQAFELHFTRTESFKNGKALILTNNDKWGAIDRNGKIQIDTVYSTIGQFEEGLAVVYGLDHHPYADPAKGIKKNYQTGVIDTDGNFIIPYGKYDEINTLENGFFAVGMGLSAEHSEHGFADKRGKLIFSKKRSNDTWIDGGLHDGYAKVYINKDRDNYQGYIDLNGDLLFKKKEFWYVEDFCEGRAFAETHDRMYSLIDRNGKVILKDAFENVVKPGFKNGVAFVRTSEAWRLIDTNGHFISDSRYEGISEQGMMGDYFVFRVDTEIHGKDNTLYGVASREGKTLVKAIMSGYDMTGYHGGLLKCLVDKKLSYVNRSGKIVWQERKGEKSKAKGTLNIDYMNRGHFYAYSKPSKDDLGGFAESENIPRKILHSDHLPADSLSVVVYPWHDRISGEYKADKVIVANTQSRNILFNAQDSRLYMKVQAKDEHGIWRDIEYLPSSWCGNSYHTLTLDPGYRWQFETPVYEGEFKTKLRIELKYIDETTPSAPRSRAKDLVVYSNEYDGSVNPAQFWYKGGYSPQGIMDPYND